MIRQVSVALLILLINSVSLSHAREVAIDAAARTPASVLDLFLFRLLESSKCNSWVKNTNLEEADLCLTSMRFDEASQTLDLHFREHPGSDALGDFLLAEDLEREHILLERLDQVAQRAGVIGEWGLLKSIPVAVFTDTGFDEASFREQLAARSIVHLHIQFENKVYSATRRLDGSVEADLVVR